MKQLLCIITVLLSAVFGNAQSYNIGLNSRQVTNQVQTQQVDVGVPPGYITKSQTINASLFVERVTSNDFYYRLIVGTSQANSNTLYQNAYFSYFGNTNTAYLTKTYNIERNAQTYNAAIGIGKIFSYQKLSL